MKPGNILLDEEGVAYITDFGLAKDSQGTVLTRPGQALGSLDYMAPEQIRSEPVTGAADVYALGCVMCELLTGPPPFADRQGMRVLWAHLQDVPPDPSEGRDGLSEDLGRTIKMALEKDPAERPPTATAYARMVQIACGADVRPADLVRPYSRPAITKRARFVRDLLPAPSVAATLARWVPRLRGRRPMRPLKGTRFAPAVAVAGERADLLVAGAALAAPVPPAGRAAAPAHLAAGPAALERDDHLGRLGEAEAERRAGADAAAALRRPRRAVEPHPEADLLSVKRETPGRVVSAGGQRRRGGEVLDRGGVAVAGGPGVHAHPARREHGPDPVAVAEAAVARRPGGSRLASGGRWGSSAPAACRRSPACARGTRRPAAPCAAISAWRRSQSVSTQISPSACTSAKPRIFAEVAVGVAAGSGAGEPGQAGGPDATGQSKGWVRMAAFS